MDGTPGAIRPTRAAGARTGRWGESGFTFVEIAIVSAVIALVTVTVMPSLSGYQTNSQVRTIAEQAMTEVRLAQVSALSQDEPVLFLFNPTADLPSRGWQGWEICGTGAPCTFSASDQTQYKTVVPRAVPYTVWCYRGSYAPSRQYVVWANCRNPGDTVEVMCFDSTRQPTPYKIALMITVATGKVSENAGSGSCP